MQVLVTGATGNTGGVAVSALVADGIDVLAASRSGRDVPGARGVRFEWGDPSTYAGALAGTDAMYLLPPMAEVDQASTVVPFLQQAVDAGMRRVVLLSASSVTPGSPGLGELPGRLPGLVPEPVVLRPSWFMQNLTGRHPLADGIRRRDTITTATGHGRVPLIDAEDIGAVAATALTATPAPAADLLLTGPRALSYDEVAAIVSEVAGRPIRHEAVSPAELAERLRDTMPARYAAVLAQLDDDIAHGTQDRVTDTVERLLARPPTALADYLRAHADRLRPDA